MNDPIILAQLLNCYNLVMAVLVKNSKAAFDYEILDKFEAGIELLGLEVKSLRQGRGKLEGSHVIIRTGEVFLVGASIPPYQARNTPADYQQDRSRRLLLKKKEIMELVGETSGRGVTIVPMAIYAKGPKIKIEIALCRGKKKYDKRQKIREREDKRKISREMKRYQPLSPGYGG